MKRHDARPPSLEDALQPLLDPVEGQYPRPWLTDTHDPAAAQVFIVGKNQAKAFPSHAVASKAAFVNALFNRGPETCRAMYDRLSPTPSLTRRNLDRLTSALADAGVRDVIQTNVVCFATPLSRNLGAHVPGRDTGRRIFQTLMRHGHAELLIAHGSGTIGELQRSFGWRLPPMPERSDDVREATVENEGRPLRIIVIPSLAPPAYNRWAKWAHAHFEVVARPASVILA